MYFLALTFKSLTGGDDGINFSLPDIALGGSYKVSLTNATTQYFFMLIVVALCFWLIRIVMASAFGRSLIAIRDNDVRASLIGIHVYRLRLAAFVIAGFLAGVSGTLFALFGRYASASYMFYHVSGEGVVWAIVGGIGTILGPAIGTGIFILIREIVSSHWQHYALIVGAFAICIVIFAPEGIVGLWKKYVLKRGA
jgi:branched-chain amino acid transport system permease protein